MSFDAGTIESNLRSAVLRFWATRNRQQSSQRQRGTTDQGSRGAVTAGAHMDGFIDLFAQLIRDAGLDDATIFRHKTLELPGYFRATKKWDLLVVVEGQLLVVIEAKSQVGPSFGNNFNNRTEEAIGSAVDFWTAFREGAFVTSPRPWLGYVFMLEDCEQSRRPVKATSPHFSIFEEFDDASYMERYKLLCRKLLRERLYDAVGFLTSQRSSGIQGAYHEHAEDMKITSFASSLAAHVSAFATMRKRIKR